MRHLSLGIFTASFILMQVLLGGAGLVFSLPASVMLAMCGGCLFFRKDRAAESITKSWSAMLCLLFAGYVVARTQSAPVVYLARWDLFLTLGAVIAYFATSCYFVSARERLFVVAALSVLALMHIGIGAIQFKQGDDYMLVPGIIRSSWEWRASGFYIYPNHLAGLLEMVGLMALSICCWGRVKNSFRILLGYVALMSIVGVALTGSRGGYLSTVFGLLCFCAISLWLVRLLCPERFWPLFITAMFGFALLIGGALFFMIRSDSISERLALIYDPTNMRPKMWLAALQQYHLSPVFGTGSGTYLYFGREFRSPTVQADPMFVHNDYLHLLAEYGLIGAVLGAAFLGVHFFGGFRGLKRIVNDQLKPEWRTFSNELALVAGALSGMLALLFHSLLDFNFHLPANLLLGAFYFGIMASPAADLRPVAETRQPRRDWARWVAPVVSLALLAVAIPLLPGEYYGELARRAVRDGRYVEGIALAERGLSFERKNPNLYFHLAEARHYLTLEVNDPVARAALHEQAAEAYEQGLILFPRDTRLLLKLGQTLDLAGRFEEADAIYQRAIRGDPNFGNVYAYYGLHFKRQRRLKMAEFYFKKALALGEQVIADPALREIEKFRNTEAGKRVLATSPEEQSDTDLLPRSPAP